MKNSVLKVLLVGFCLWSVSGAAWAGGSFRLENGQLLRTGMSRIEVLSMVGAPLSKDVDTHGVSTDNTSGGKTVESWSYILNDTFGQKFLVTIVLEGGTVTEISSKQQGRM
ncbi:MAG: hypothetical protein ACRD4Q_16010 [Candidatus Acidiferrales bacterium]